MASRKRCEGKRRMWRGHTLDTFKCGRVARFVFETRVGTTQTHYVCGDNDCFNYLTVGYRAYNVRELDAQRT